MIVHLIRNFGFVFIFLGTLFFLQTSNLLASDQNKTAVDKPQFFSSKNNPLQPVRTDSPRDTMRTFMEAMEQYRLGIESGNKKLKNKINDAVRCLNLESTPYLLRKDAGREAAIFLKEVIDRIIVIDYEKIPETAEELGSPFWRLKNTEISIGKVETGDRMGEWLFRPDSTYRAREFYETVKHLNYLPGTGGGAHYKKSMLDQVIPAWAQNQILGFYHWQWMGLLTAIFLGFIFKSFVQFIIRLIRRFAEKTKTNWDVRLIEVVERPIALISAVAVWFVFVQVLRFEGVIKTVLLISLQLVLSFAFIRLAYLLTQLFGDFLKSRSKDSRFPVDDQLVPLINKTLRVFVVVIGCLLMIQNLGINIMSLLAGLGLGGLAFALAAKDTAANLFGSIMIFLDKPCKVGDWIKVDAVEGTIEEIGFRSTRMRTFYNSLISVPNSVLATANIDNMGARQFRRVKTVLGVAYDTPPEKMEAFLAGIINIIENNPFTRKDYYHVVFNDYADCSLNILVYFFLKVPDWAAELVERQNIFLEIHRLAHELDVEFAFPTQTLHVGSFPEKLPLRTPTHYSVEELEKKAEQFSHGSAFARPNGLGIYNPPFKQKSKHTEDLP